MKKVLFFVVLMLGSSSVFAQSQQTEVHLSTGFFSDTHAAALVSNAVFFPIVSLFVKHDFKVTTTGVYSADILFDLKNQHAQTGVGYSYEKLTIEETNNEVKTTYFLSTNSIIAQLNYRYLIKSNGYIYSGFGAGVKFKQYSGETTNANATSLAYDFTAIGFHFGSDIAAFGELGFGSKGLIRAGVSLSF